MNIAFFHVGPDTRLPALLCRSAKRFNPDCKLIQVTDRNSPLVAEADEAYRFDGASDQIMFFRTYCFSQLTRKEPTWFLDTDMLVLEKLPCLEGVGLCVRVFQSDVTFNHNFNGMDLGEHKGRQLGEVYPILGCAVFTSGENVWGDLYKIYEQLPQKYRPWYGDQEALRTYALSGKFIKLLESEYACLPEFINSRSRPKIIHFKGGARKQSMLLSAKQMGFL